MHGMGMAKKGKDELAEADQMTQEGLELARHTRRKHIGARYPGGKLKLATGEPPWAYWRRIKDHAMAIGAHPDMGTVIGRLSLLGRLSDRQAAAAIWVAETIGRYERLSGMPRRSAASPAYERAYGRDHDGDGVAATERRAGKARKDYDRLTKWIPEKPSLARTVLEDVCCNDQDVNSLHVVDLGALLTVIANERGFKT